MGKAGAARRLASAAAYGGGGLSLLGGAAYGVLRAEAKIARHVIGEPEDGFQPPDATGWYGTRRPGPPIRILLLGDSSAAGYGVHRVEDVPGAQLASAVSEQADRRVYLAEFAFIGARSSDLPRQVEESLAMRPDVAVILIGGNDVTHSVRPAAAVRHLSNAVRRLRELDVQVVVGTCPDLGTVRPIPPPLKQVAREWSRRLAAAQAIAVVEEGGRSVSLATILGPEFHADPAAFFGPDRFHPSAEGYAALARVLAPSVVSAAGFGLPTDQELAPARGDRVMPVARAAVAASRTPGTEIDGTRVGGDSRGVRGLWVNLRHRRQQPTGVSEGPSADEHQDAGPEA